MTDSMRSRNNRLATSFHAFYFLGYMHDCVLYHAFQEHAEH